MEIVINGEQDPEQAAECLSSVIRLFNERYGVANFREISLSVTLMDNEGDDVELVDPQTRQAFRVFEVYQSGDEPREVPKPDLRLIVDNTTNL